HVARILAARNEHEVALELLDSRKKEFADDAVYLGQLILENVALKKYEEALPYSRRRVQLAQTASDLEIAMSQFAQVSKKAKQTTELIKMLSESPRRSIQDTCLLAELLERDGDRTGADRLLTDLADKNSLLVTSQQIRLYSQRHDWTRAADATRRLVELPEGRKSIHVRQLVELYQHDYKIAEALKWVQEWKKLSPGSTLPWLTEARLLTQQGKNKEAINTLRVAVQEFDDDQELRARLAQLYVEENHYNDAERIYWRQYEDSKDLAGKLRAVQSLAEIAELTGGTEQLLERFNERHRTNRRSIEPLLALAEIHRVNYNYEGRRKALVEATRLKADDVQLLHEVARIEESEGDWERAMATLERAAKLDKTTRSREKMARLHLNNGNLDDGYEILYELAGTKTSNPRTAESIADAMMSAQDWETSIAFLSDSVSQFPDDYRLRYLQAIALEEEDRTDEAIAGFLEMLKIDKELSTPFSKAPKAPWAGYPLIDLLPQQSIDYMEFGWLTQQAYSHRQQQGGYTTAYRGLPQAGITMPRHLEA
ncbi:MAG: tetratricopeptide repeat protein, partial [Planctomycetales bacterium]